MYQLIEAILTGRVSTNVVLSYPWTRPWARVALYNALIKAHERKAATRQERTRLFRAASKLVEMPHFNLPVIDVSQS